MTQITHPKLLLALMSVMLISVPPTTPAQSLGEIAQQYRKEREALKKKGESPARVFTNDDIARMPPIAILKSSLHGTASAETKPSAPSRPPGTTTNGAHTKAPAEAPGKSRNGEKSREYWQARFKSARARLAHAKEEQTLVQDELHLLQIQQARELNPDRSRKLNGQIGASTVELESKRAATEKAQRAMEQLQKEFKESGAPQNWIQEGKTPE